MRIWLDVIRGETVAVSSTLFLIELMLALCPSMMSANAKTATRLAFSLLVVLLQKVRHAVFTAGIVVVIGAFGAFVDFDIFGAFRFGYGVVAMA